MGTPKDFDRFPVIYLIPSLADPAAVDVEAKARMPMVMTMCAGEAVSGPGVVEYVHDGPRDGSSQARSTTPENKGWSPTHHAMLDRRAPQHPRRQQTRCKRPAGGTTRGEGGLCAVYWLETSRP